MKISYKKSGYQMTTDLETGLTDKEVNSRKSLFYLKDKTDKALFLIALKECLHNHFDRIMMLIPLIFGIGMIILFLMNNSSHPAIICILGLALTFSISSIPLLKPFKKIEEYKSLIKKESLELTSVIRNGRKLSIPRGELTVGDLIPLKAEMTIPTVGMLISGRILVDSWKKPSLGHPEYKRNKKRTEPIIVDNLYWATDIVLDGQKVLKGSAVMVVTQILGEWIEYFE